MGLEIWLEERVKAVAGELGYVKTVDGFLVKLSTLLYEITNECFGNPECARGLFEKALKHPLLARELSRLSCYADAVKKTVEADPRFRDLRTYSDVLLGVLASLECRGEALEFSRDATFRIVEKEELERREVIEERAKKPLLLKPRKRYLTYFVIGLVAAAVLLIAILLVVSKLP